eukprot:TRINITY_DN13907_c0_g1_i1.p1 TRINITY_DN13907_c0_g1~~TRINITY_DN13907_c0_g1_i1.p1  ORF type:complete len:405 (-),score=118.90 TRINITY_DN13907_c0_g1_i1:33-1247(-)
MGLQNVNPVAPVRPFIPIDTKKKIIPKNIPNDKERLYEETLHLKGYINTLIEENTTVKARNLQLEKENLRMTKLIEDYTKAPKQHHSYYTSIPSPNSKQTESSLIVVLKKTIRDLKAEITTKTEELESIKRTVKYTKIKEAEVEAKTYAEEVLRLKSLLQVSQSHQRSKQFRSGSGDLNTIDEEIEYQMKTIEGLRKDNTELVSAIKILQNDLQDYEVEKEIAEKNMGKMEAEIGKARRALREKEKECEELKTQALALSREHETRKRDREREELARFSEVEMAKKNETIRNLEQTISDLKVRMQHQSMQEMSEKSALRLELKKMKEENLEFQKLIDNLQAQRAELEGALKSHNISVERNGDSTPKDMNVQPFSMKKIPRVRSDEVSAIRTVSYTHLTLPTIYSV